MSNDKKTVLVVENDIYTNRLICEILKENNFIPLSSSNGKDACSLVSSHLPNLVVLNMELEDMDGAEVISYIREWSNLPIIAISLRSRETDKVSALDSGADDYITKPFGSLEFIARVRALLRYRRLTPDEGQEYERSYRFDDLSVDFMRRIVMVGKKVIKLTPIEFNLLEILCRNSGKVVTYGYLLKKIWGPYAKNDNKILRVNITNIRKKLEADTQAPKYIITEPGVGYRLAENEK